MTENPAGTFVAPSTDAVTVPGYSARVIDPTYEITPLTFDRDVVQASLSNLPKTVAGAAQVTFRYTLEMAGEAGDLGISETADFSTPGGESHGFMKHLRSLGFVVENAGGYVALSGTVTNSPFKHGVATSAGNDVIGDWHGANTPRIWLDGASETGTITQGTTTASIATASGERLVARLRDDPNSQTGGYGGSACSVELYADGLFIRGRGCRGTATVTCEHGNTVRWAIEMTGVLHEVVDAAYIPDASVNVTQNQPPTYIGVALAAITNDATQEEELAISHNSVVIDLGNEVIARPNSSAADGIDCAIITARNPTVTVNPDAVTIATGLDWLNNYKNGQSFQLRLIVGTTAAGAIVPGNTFEISMSGVVASAVGDEERDGVDVFALQGDITTGQYADGSNAVDNDIVIGAA